MSKLIADEGYVIPLLQYVMPIVHSDAVTVTPYTSGDLLPQAVGKA